MALNAHGLVWRSPARDRQSTIEASHGLRLLPEYATSFLKSSGHLLLLGLLCGARWRIQGLESLLFSLRLRFDLDVWPSSLLHRTSNAWVTFETSVWFNHSQLWSWQSISGQSWGCQASIHRIRVLGSQWTVVQRRYQDEQVAPLHFWQQNQ